MSVTMLDTSLWTAAERQAAACDAYRASGYRLSGIAGRQRGAADPGLVDPDVVRRVIAGRSPVALAVSTELALDLRSGGRASLPGRASSASHRCSQFVRRDVTGCRSTSSR